MVNRWSEQGQETLRMPFMSSAIMHQILQTIEQMANSTPSAIEFEMAYEARVAIDRIRFAIKHTEQFGPRSDQMREAGLQLLDALQRLEKVERRFQARSRNGLELTFASVRTEQSLNGHAARRSQERTADRPIGAPRGDNSK
jgi:hypothetical protein